MYCNEAALDRQFWIDASIYRQHVLASPAVTEGILYMGMKTAGLFIHSLSGGAQRQAFLETWRGIDGHLKWPQIG